MALLLALLLVSRRHVYTSIAVVISIIHRRTQFEKRGLLCES